MRRIIVPNQSQAMQPAQELCSEDCSNMDVISLHSLRLQYNDGGTTCWERWDLIGESESFSENISCKPTPLSSDIPQMLSQFFQRSRSTIFLANL
jgi:hypothetical protein